MTDYKDIVNFSKRTENKSALSRAYLSHLWDRNVIHNISSYKSDYFSQGKYTEALLQALENNKKSEVKRILEITGIELDPDLEIQAAGYRGDIKDIQRIMENRPDASISRALVGAAKGGRIDVINMFSNYVVNRRIPFETALMHGKRDAAIALYRSGAWSPKLGMFIGYSDDDDLAEYFEGSYFNNHFIEGILWRGNIERILGQYNYMTNKNISKISEIDLDDLTEDMRYALGRGGTFIETKDINYLRGAGRGGHLYIIQKLFDPTDPDQSNDISEEAARENNVDIFEWFQKIKDSDDEDIDIVYGYSDDIAMGMGKKDVLRFFEDKERSQNDYFEILHYAATNDNYRVLSTDVVIDTLARGLDTDDNYVKYLIDERHLIERIAENDAIDLFSGIHNFFMTGIEKNDIKKILEKALSIAIKKSATCMIEYIIQNNIPLSTDDLNNIHPESARILFQLGYIQEKEENKEN